MPHTVARDDARRYLPFVLSTSGVGIHVLLKREFMNKENSITRIIFLAVMLFSTSLWAGAETLTNDSIVKMQAGGLSEGVIVAKIKSSQNSFDLSTDKIVALKKAGVSDKVIEAMIQTPSQSQVGNTPPPSRGNPFDPNYYNPGQMPQAGGQSRLRGQQGIDDEPYTGVDGMTQQAGENCELLEKRRQAQIPTLNLQGMNIASVTLEQKGNGVHYTGDITLYGPSKGCIPIYNTKDSGSFNALSPSGTVEIAWVYVEFDGISLIKFPMIGKRAGVVNLGQPHITKIGDMQTGSLFLRDVNATVTIASAQQQSINIFQQKVRP